jgi:molybdate transport system substrate-binding protein
MRILSTLAVKKVLDEAVPLFTPLLFPPLSFSTPGSSSKVEVSIDPTALVLERVKSGERGDLAILTEAGINDLCTAGILVPNSRIELCVSEIGVAVPRGANKPDISSTDAVRNTLLAARSIAYSKAGASGIFFAGLIQRLGIADVVNAKATVIPAGFTAALLVDGRADLAIQQISELMAVDGIDIVGPLPNDINERLRFPGAVFTGSAYSEQANAFLKFLARPEMAERYRLAGLIPI